ncbi:MAG: cache domain-containing protein [Campylobacterales bacterium]|nr:cache domain-containing protein [Campylobacterales bacterium]
MTFITEKNVSKSIIYLFVFIMTAMICLITYFYVKNTNADFDVEMRKFIDSYYLQEKRLLKKEIDIIIDIIKYNATISEKPLDAIKKETVSMLNNITFEERRSNYIFVYDILDINGGKDFARLLVNPNRADLVGRVLSTHYKDLNGKKFREAFLKDIREKGESYTQYAYTKISSGKVNQKLSYFKYFPQWNWVICVGVYLDDIENDIASKKRELHIKLKVQLVQTVLLFFFFLSLGIFSTIFVSERIDEFFSNYRKKVKVKSEALWDLNQTLEKRVLLEIEKNRDKEQFLVEKARFISMGEMISHIAHQWRQPLSELSSILMGLKFKHLMGKLDSECMDTKAKEAEKVIDYMSHTIDDFRNFFMPRKEKQEFVLLAALSSISTIISSTLTNYKIDLIISIEEEVKIYTYLNEFEQVVLNIISNAKDVLISNNIKDPYIKITVKNEVDSIILYIEDNGGGVQVEPKSKIFDPYFTTKSDSEGTGIGLYMSKIIVEKNMNGKLDVKNSNEGAIFSIYLKKEYSCDI